MSGHSYRSASASLAPPFARGRRDLHCTRPDIDPDWFYTDDQVAAGFAADLCITCPAIADCLVWAISHEPDYGIWAATTPTQRRALARRRDTANRLNQIKEAA